MKALFLHDFHLWTNRKIIHNTRLYLGILDFFFLLTELHIVYLKMLSGAAHMAGMWPRLSSIGHLMTYWGETRWLQGLGHTVHFIDEKSNSPQCLTRKTQYKSSVLNHIDLRGHMISISLWSNPRAEVKLEFHFWISETYLFLFIYLFSLFFFFFFFWLPTIFPFENSPGAPALFSKRDIFLTGRPGWAVQSVHYLPCSPNPK